MSVRRRGILPWRPCLILDASVPLKSFLAHGFFRQVTLALRLTDLYILTPFSPTTSLRTRGCCSKLKNSPLLGFHHRATRARCLPDARLCFTQLHNRARSPRSSSLLASFACARLFCLCERNLSTAQHDVFRNRSTLLDTAPRSPVHRDIAPSSPKRLECVQHWEAKDKGEVASQGVRSGYERPARSHLDAATHHTTITRLAALRSPSTPTRLSLYVSVGSHSSSLGFRGS
ncbi:hypothetical protein EV126DRAFT_223449 [Verticillium dahliae]|nr:hypothetical protein EV126DRAFT_223449 [Verticillium dahliae]